MLSGEPSPGEPHPTVMTCALAPASSGCRGGGRADSGGSSGERVAVRFDGEDQPVSIRPHLLQVV